jgi:opacity protein-like surface antigen
VAAPAEPAPPPAPAAAPAAPIIRPYAWIKPTVIFTSAPVDSFGQPNASAATAAGNPVRAAIRDEASLTFQAQQSRTGIWFNDKAPVRAQLELDFFDATKASPTSGALPRLRIAKVEWQLADSLLLVAGQDWDLFQPVNPTTFDIVSVAYQAGNTAFMRQQAKFIYSNDSLELAGAIGLAGVNNTAIALLPEYSRIPTVAVRAALLFGAMGRIGISALGTSWRFAPGAANERKAFAGGVGLYGDVTPVSGLNLRFEAYGGRNLANLGTLSLATGNAAEDLNEAGGFLSAKYSLTEKHALYALGGAAMVLNDEDVLPSYTYAGAMPGDMPAESTAVFAGGAGIKQNITGRLGYEYKYDKMIAFVLEGFLFQTEHVLNQQFDADLDQKQTAVGAEVGLFFTF